MVVPASERLHHFTKREISAAESRAANAPKGPTGYPMDGSMSELYGMLRANRAYAEARRAARGAGKAHH